MTVNAAIKEYGAAAIELMTSGPIVNDGNWAQCATSNFLASVAVGYPLFDAWINPNFTTATALNDGGIVLVTRSLEIGGVGNHAPQPSDVYPHDTRGTFQLDNVTGEQWQMLEDLKRPLRDVEVWIKNISGDQLPAGWSLSVRPLAYVPSLV